MGEGRDKKIRDLESGLSDSEREQMQERLKQAMVTAGESRIKMTPREKAKWWREIKDHWYGSAGVSGQSSTYIGISY